MTSIAELHEILQALLSSKANEMAKTSGFIRRQRQVSGAGFAQALVLGGLGHPAATRRDMQQQARQAGVEISVQGLDQRFDERAVGFMRDLLAEGLTAVVRREGETAILPQFKGVYVTDCTRLVWGEAGVKMAVRWEIQHGQLQADLMALPQHDQKAPVVDAPLPAGALHLGDLGFFKLQRFRQWSAAGVYWLTRYKVGTHLATPEGEALDLKSLLTGDEPLHLAVLVGKGKQALPAALIAAPLPPAALDKRLARLNEQARLDQRPLSARQRDLAAWTIYLSNVPDLTFAQAHLLARTRWQIELLFKLWKSHGLVLRSRSANPHRQQCEGYAKLLGVLIAHWALLVAGWQQHRLGAVEALRLLRTHLPLLQRALAHPTYFALFFRFLQQDLALAPPRPKRRQNPLAFQLWASWEVACP